MANHTNRKEKLAAIDRLQLTLWPDHQRLVVAVALAGLLLVAGFYGVGNFYHGGWVDIETTNPREYQFKVDLNRADWIELYAIPGIGEVTAKQIVEFRESRGGFLEHQQLQEIPGIGPKTLRKMQPFLLPVQ